MKYKNPVLKGFYPDPSVCYANGKFYMVCSSFQYFPGVPLFESDNLVNWKQIGHVLTRKSQVELDGINSSGGVFAPTIRYNDGRFYMVTTNDTTHRNFYVWTDDIYGEWSEPVEVEQGGIDPSLYFENGRAYFMSNGEDDNGVGGVTQCEIDIETGRKLTPSKNIWKGSGGRFLESPHLYKIGEYYYLMAAEGGTEYGHMITYARGESVWGPFKSYRRNPVLTNRNKAPNIIQGIGHGDLVCDKNGNWHILCLGFRQIHIWMQYHNLGREVMLVPVKFDKKGWFTVRKGTCEDGYKIDGDFEQDTLKPVKFGTDEFNLGKIFLRHPNPECYTFSDKMLTLLGSKYTLDDVASPTFVGLRQRDFCFEMSADVTLEGNEGEAGITAYMCENEHYEIALKNTGGVCEAILRLNIGGIRHIQNVAVINGNSATLIVRGNNLSYDFYLCQFGIELRLGSGQSKYLTSEVAGGFTGTVLGMYASGHVVAEFTEFKLSYTKALT